MGMRKTITLTPLYDISINWDYYERHQVPGATPAGCTHWNAGLHRQGYGFMSAVRHRDNRGIMTTTHRIAARIKYGRAIDSKEMVVHTCSNMACMNPDHLMIGTRTDLEQIMRRNQRHRHGSPPNKPRCVDLVRAMNTAELQAMIEMTRPEIVEHYGDTLNRARYLKSAARTELVRRQ